MTKTSIHIGTITGAHGVRGQVKLRSTTGDPEELMEHALTDQSGRRAFKLTRHGIKDDSLIVSIEGVKDRNEAELLKGTKLFAQIDEDENKNRWSYNELTGLEARLLNGKTYGRVSAVHNFGAGDILDIELQNGGSEMLPFSNDFVGDVEVAKGYLIVFPPEYLEGEKEDE